MSGGFGTESGAINLRVFVDGGMAESFFAERIVITSLIGMPAPTPASLKKCSVTRLIGCLNETNCGADPTKRCLPHLVPESTDTWEGCASACDQHGFQTAGVELDQCWCGDEHCA